MSDYSTKALMFGARSTQSMKAWTLIGSLGKILPHKMKTGNSKREILFGAEITNLRMEK